MTPTAAQTVRELCESAKDYQEHSHNLYPSIGYLKRLELAITAAEALLPRDQIIRDTLAKINPVPIDQRPIRSP